MDMQKEAHILTACEPNQHKIEFNSMFNCTEGVTKHAIMHLFLHVKRMYLLLQKLYYG